MAFKIPALPPDPSEPAGPPAPGPLELWKAWKADPSPATTAPMLAALSPTIDKAAAAAVGDVNPVVRGRARSMALAGLRTFDPARGASLSGHLYNHLQGLKRYAARAAAGVYVPERVSLDRRAVGLAERELADRLGRDPTADELADHSGFSPARIAKVRGAPGRAANSGFFSSMGEAGEGLDPAVRDRGTSQQSWERLVAQDFHPTDQKILEYHRAGLANDAIARKLRLSPAAISTRKRKMQAVFDREAELSPFL